MKILITNDDGIAASGIIRLAKAAQKYGEVWVVAPDGQRSGASHSINLHSPICVKEVAFPVPGVHAYMTSGSPADCTRLGILNLVPGRPDVVFSGINYGFNVGRDVMYSGTVGAAMEANFHHIPAIAFSEGIEGASEITDAYLDKILADLLPVSYVEQQIINVNFPDCTLSELKGIQKDCTVSKAYVFDDHYDCVGESENGKEMMVVGAFQKEAEEGSDLYAMFQNYISIGTITDIH